MASAPRAPPGGDTPAPPDVFEVRLNTIDYYMAKPVPGLDETVSPFRGGAPVDQVRPHGWNVGTLDVSSARTMNVRKRLETRPALVTNPSYDKTRS
jgi:hypothetical protein